MMRLAAVIAVIVAGALTPSVAFAAGAEVDWVQFGSSIFNFGIYVALIYFLARKPVAAFYEARRNTIAASIEAAAAATRAAEAELSTTMQRIAGLDDERAQILAEFRELGEQERSRILAAAELEAARIVSDAVRTAERETARAKAALEAQMVDLALGRARDQIRTQLTDTTHAKLIDDGIDALSRVAAQEA